MKKYTPNDNSNVGVSTVLNASNIRNARERDLRPNTSYAGPSSRDYSLELYRKHLGINPANEKFEMYDRIERTNPRSKDTGPVSRSLSKSVGRTNITIKNDNINVGRLMDFYRDMDQE